MTTLLASSVQADTDAFERNAARQTSNHADQCFLCGRGLTQSAVDRGYFIHLATDGRILDTRDIVGVALDQGWFPVGSECAKRLPRTHREKVGA